MSFTIGDVIHIAIHDVKTRPEGIFRATVEFAEGGARSLDNRVWSTERDLRISSSATSTADCGKAS